METKQDATKLNAVDDNDHVVAVTFYSKQTSISERSFYKGIFSQTNKEDITRLQNGLKSAAEKLGKTAPQMEITLYLVPDAANLQNHNSIEYIETKEKMIEEAKAFYGADILIKNFIKDTSVTQDELDFLQGCQSMGSVADLVKTRTIIDSKGRVCLQTDSNVTWANNNFQRLYDLTFKLNQDAFNASRCSDVYVSAHNKLVFTASDSKLPEILERKLGDYCRTYKDDPVHKEPTFNGIYDIPFGEAMNEYGIVYRAKVDNRRAPGKTFDFFPANLEDDRYKLMPLVIACQRESWRAKDKTSDPDQSEAELQGNLTIGLDKTKLPAMNVIINTVDYNYYHFKSLIKVFTNIPSWHTEEDKYKYVDDTKDFFIGAERTRNLFIAKQDTALCMQILATYYNAARDKTSDRSFAIKNGNHLLILAKLIPNTKAGNALCQELFGCNVPALHTNPIRVARVPKEEQRDKLILDTQPTYHQANEKLIDQIMKSCGLEVTGDTKKDLAQIAAAITSDNPKSSELFGPDKETLFETALKHKWKDIVTSCIKQKTQSLDYKTLSYLILYANESECKSAISNMRISETLAPPNQQEPSLIRLAVHNKKFKHIGYLLNLPDINLHDIVGYDIKSLLSSQLLMNVVLSSGLNLESFGENLVNKGVKESYEIIVKHDQFNLLIDTLGFKNLCALAEIKFDSPKGARLFALAEIKNLQSQPPSQETSKRIGRILVALRKPDFEIQKHIQKALSENTKADRQAFFNFGEGVSEAEERFITAISPIVKNKDLRNI